MILLYDGNFLLHRILKTPDFFDLNYLGVRTGGIFGVAQTLHTSLSSVPRDSRSIVIWDGSRSTRRNSFYPEYKSNRVPITEQDKLISEEYFKTYNHQKKIIIEELLPSLGILSIREPLHEADDVIYKICQLYQDQEIMVVSEDKDLLQLIYQFPNVRVFRPIKKELVTKANFKELTEVPCSLYLLFKALLGDKSDNIPGVTGCGEKTVYKIINMLDESRPIESLIEITKKFYDEDMAKPKQTLRKESKLYKGLGNVARNLELMDLAREEFKPLVVHEMKQKIDSFVSRFDETQLQVICQNYGFKMFLNNWDFWVLPFRKAV